MDLAFHGPGPAFMVLASSSVEVPASRFIGGTRASSIQNKSSSPLAGSGPGVRDTVTVGLPPRTGDAGCDGFVFRLFFEECLGCCAFDSCERSIGYGMSCAASHSRCRFSEAARSMGSCRREKGDLVAWCTCTALAICLTSQGERSSSSRASSNVSMLTDIYWCRLSINGGQCRNAAST